MYCMLLDFLNVFYVQVNYSMCISTNVILISNSYILITGSVCISYLKNIYLLFVLYQSSIFSKKQWKLLNFISPHEFEFYLQ